MKKDQIKQIAELSIKELVQKAKEVRKEIADLVLDQNMRKLKDVKSVSKKKNELARMLTFLRQKQLLEKLESKVKEEPKEKAETKKEKNK